MNGVNQSCSVNKEDLQSYQHQVYVVVYAIIFTLGLPCNLMALWVFRQYMKETKKAVLFMMNLAVADLMQVLSLPLRIYYYHYNVWPFGQPLCIFCFYLKYVNMYASIFFMACISLRRCELNMHPLKHRSAKKKGDLIICTTGWLLVFLCCIPFPLLRTPRLDQVQLNVEAGGALVGATSPSSVQDSTANPQQVCFSELPMQLVGVPVVWMLLIMAELLGFVLPLVLVLVCACLNMASLRSRTEGAAHDRREQRRAMRMVMSCLTVFVVCFVPYHVTFPLDVMAKVNALPGCGLRELVLRSHPVTLCLASFNSSLDPIMYYLTTKEFWRRGRGDVGRHTEEP